MGLWKRDRGAVRRGSAWALVTGAAIGIGRQYAERLAVLGYNLVLVDIREEITSEAVVIAEQHKVKTVSRVMDLACERAAHELHAWSVAEGYEFDVVINNAGIFSFCDILNTPIERLERVILLHDLTLTLMCRLYGEDMQRRGKGRIQSVSQSHRHIAICVCKGRRIRDGGAQTKRHINPRRTLSCDLRLRFILDGNGFSTITVGRE